MPGKTNIPRDIKQMNKFIRNTYALLIAGTPTGQVRYNWTNAYTAQWLAFLNLWTPLFTLYDSKATYTTAIKDELLVIINNLILYAETNKLIQLVRATNPLTPTDCIEWNLPANLALTVIHTHHAVIDAAAITDRSITKAEAVFVKLIPKAGNMVHIEAFTEIAESGRPHKEKGYDLFEYAYGVFYSDTANLPTSAADARLEKKHSSHASFIAQFAADTKNLHAITAGAPVPVKEVIMYGHWAKSKHPNEDAPWCGPFTTALL
ncbi:MAG TPA: hypothetical protein VF411_06715 [Bacteroidia bacterium]